MKYSMTCLDKALSITLPGSEVWPAATLATRLDMAAKQCFLYPEKFTGTDAAFAVFLVRKALLELSAIGWITFGDVDEFWM